MKTFMCIPLHFSLKFSGAKANKKTTRRNSAKVLDVSMWPGESSLNRELSRDVKMNIPTPIHQLKTPSSTVTVDKDQVPTNEQPGITQLPIPVEPSQEQQPEAEASAGPSSSMNPMTSVQEWVESLGDFTPESHMDNVCWTSDEEQPRSPPKAPVKKQPELGSTGVVDADILRSMVNPSLPKADMNGLGLQSVPLLGAFNNLKRLSLSRNSIVKIPRGCLPRSLDTLDLSTNKITALDGLRNLHKLRVLNLSGNRISRIGQDLQNCVSLRELDLSGNMISLVEGLHRLRKLFLLDLSNNRLSTAKSLAQLIANQKTLEVLNLTGNSVLLNLSEAQVRRLAMDVAPGLIFLNKQRIKNVPVRELVVGKFSKTEQSDMTRASSRPRYKAIVNAKRVKSLQVHHRRLASSGTRTNRVSIEKPT